MDLKMRTVFDRDRIGLSPVGWGQRGVDDLSIGACDGNLQEAAGRKSGQRIACSQLEGMLRIAFVGAGGTS